jgi:ubiquinol-cytochrome c reductase cytochrome c1 subunit
MVRVLGILVGLVFAFASLWSFGHGAYAYLSSPHEQAVEKRFHMEPEHVAFSFDGPFGRYDRRQLQRGFQVYKEVCSACHSLKLVAFRDLKDLGYREAEVKAIAANWQTQVPDIDPKTGDPKGRKALPADHFPSPFQNETAARAANNNALPPDLSLITKAREGGPDYVYSILTGFQNPPANLPRENRPGLNLHYNPYFANLNIAMPPPLVSDGQVGYQDGTKATKKQMAQDVAAFLAWTAEPRLEDRRDVGMVVLAFLLIATILAYLAYQNIWHGGGSRTVRRIGVLDPDNMAKRDAASAAGLDG